MNIEAFQKKIWEFYKKNGRHELSWRKTDDAYKIFVSEAMLQQTQVSRVIPKYEEFLGKFPSFYELANAPQSEVIKAWQGLGYNRRALFLKRAAEIIDSKHRGNIPTSYNDLLVLPGIGPNTAGSIMAFVHNIPVAFIETNIRRVFIHEFFHNKKEIADKEIFPLIERSLDHKNPREWYYAVMDYGAHLGKEFENANKRSSHYTKQSKFKGSKREVRGVILKMLSEKKEMSLSAYKKIDTLHNVEEIVLQMEKEGFVFRKKNKIYLK